MVYTCDKCGKKAAVTASETSSERDALKDMGWFEFVLCDECIRAFGANEAVTALQQVGGQNDDR